MGYLGNLGFLHSFAGTLKLLFVDRLLEDKNPEQ